MILTNFDAGERLRPLGAFYTDEGDPTITTIRDGQAVLIYKGFLYYDTGKSGSDIMAFFKESRNTADFAEFKGHFCGVYLDLTNRTVTGFNDHLGICDLFFWAADGRFAISDSFNAVCDMARLNSSSFDQVTFADFLLYGFPVGENTFFESVKRQPPATIGRYVRGKYQCTQYWKPCEVYDGVFDPKAKCDELDALLSQSARRILNHCGSGKRLCLNLSGGLDSRIAAYYFQKHDVSLIAHFFGETDSSEGRTAKNIAGRLGIPLYHPNNHRDLVDYFDRSHECHAMANLEWCKYLTGYCRIPAFDVLLSGYLGEHILGGWGYQPKGSRARLELAAWLHRQSLKKTSLMIDGRRSTERLEEYVNALEGSDMTRSWLFWIRSMKLFNKWCGLFNTLQSTPHFSIFCDIDIVHFSFTIPEEWQFPRRLYRLFFRTRLPEYAEVSIRASDKHNKHKPIEQWVYGNTKLEAYCRANMDSDALSHIGCVGNLSLEHLLNITSCIQERSHIHTFFQLLTLSKFIKRYTRIG